MRSEKISNVIYYKNDVGVNMQYGIQEINGVESGGYRIAELDRKFDVSFLVGMVEPCDYDMHIHTVLYEFLVFLNGNVEYFVNGSKKKLEYGDLVVVSPGEIHKPYIIGGADYERIVFHISESLLEEYSTLDTNFSRCLKGHSRHFYHFSEEELKGYVGNAESINISMKNPKALGTDIMIQSYQQLLLVQLIRKVQEMDEPGKGQDEIGIGYPPKLREAVVYINDNFKEDISVDSVAENINISRSYLGSIFKKYTGDTLWSYVLSKRLAAAQKYILDGDSITDACYKSGFRNYAHFVKSFHKAFGMSPQKFRNSERTEFYI